MNSGKYVFAQLLELFNKYEFEKCVTRYKGNHHVRELNCWNQFGQLFFGQLTSRNSLRDICVCLKAHKKKLYHLGIKQNVNQSTLSRTNEGRDWRIFADFGQYLIDIVRPLYANNPIPNIDIHNDVFALDSTTISLSINLFKWAEGKYSRGAVKIHTLLDLRGSIPTYIFITDGKYNDIVLKGPKSKQRYPERLRRVEYYDDEKNIVLTFLSNNFDVSALEIARLYRNRWEIELFFKWIKGNLIIKTLWGHSENAVKVHIWMAICTYLLVAYVKHMLQSPLSIYEIIQILGISTFDKTPIKELLTEIQVNQNVKERNDLFSNQF